ncbi:MAG TPA: hypothetical protein VMV10_08945 [Pirellulales bacterium]|nr:hypothetical protein [Pirellulales bacterium]
MHPIKAVWTNGRIVPAEPVDWPEGSELLVEVVGRKDKIGLTEEEWRDDPESIAAWVADVEAIEPPIWAEGEREEYERWRVAHRRFNIEAVRQQMEEMPGGDAP